MLEARLKPEKIKEQLMPIRDDTVSKERMFDATCASGDPTVIRPLTLFLILSFSLAFYNFLCSSIFPLGWRSKVENPRLLPGLRDHEWLHWRGGLLLSQVLLILLLVTGVRPLCTLHGLVDARHQRSQGLRGTGIPKGLEILVAVLVLGGGGEAIDIRNYLFITYCSWASCAFLTRISSCSAS